MNGSRKRDSHLAEMARLSPVASRDLRADISLGPWEPSGTPLARNRSGVGRSLGEERVEEPVSGVGERDLGEPGASALDRPARRALEPLPPAEG